MGHASNACRPTMLVPNIQRRPVGPTQHARQ
jgi:hypothetical protein